MKNEHFTNCELFTSNDDDCEEGKKEQFQHMVATWLEKKEILRRLAFEKLKRVVLPIRHKVLRVSSASD